MDEPIVLPQAVDYTKSKKHIPDLLTWAQYFAIYASVLLVKHPERAQSLFGTFFDQYVLLCNKQQVS